MGRKGIAIRTVGRCIYCGNASGELTNEHILPYALGGNLRLDLATCKTCQDVTSRVEMHITRPIAGMLRTRLGIQTRNPRRREEIRQTIYVGSEEGTVLCSPDEFPAVFSYPIFARPGIVEGRAPTKEYPTHGVWSLGSDADFKRMADAFLIKYGGTSLRLASSRPGQLMSFMAKVGHCAAVALLGLDCFKPLLNSAAIQPEKVHADVLGGGGMFAPIPDVLHLIELRQTDGPSGAYIFARLRWFACLEPDPRDPLTTHAGFAPPALLGLVGRPVDDRLVGKMGQIEIKRNGEHTFRIYDAPQTAVFVPAPGRRSTGR